MEIPNIFAACVRLPNVWSSVFKIICFSMSANVPPSAVGEVSSFTGAGASDK